MKLIMPKGHVFLMRICRLVPIDNMWNLVGVFACLILGVICNLCLPITLKKVVDKLSISPNIDNIINLFIIYSILLFGSKLLFELKTFLFARWERILIEKSFSYYFNECIKNIPTFYKDNTIGSIASRLYMSVWGLKNFIGDMILTILPTFLEFVFISFSVCYFFNAYVAMAVLIGLSSYLLLSVYCNKKIIALQRPLRQKVVETEGVLIELLMSWKDTKLLNSYHKMHALFEKHTLKISSLSANFTNQRFLLNFILGMLIALTVMMANYFAIIQFTENIITLGSIFLINNYLLQILKPLENIVITSVRMSHDWNDFMLGRELQYSAKEEIIFNEKFKIEQPPKLLELKNVSLANSLYNINLNFHEKEKVAIVGESGAGKSSIFDLVCRIRNNYEGAVLLNNVDIQNISHSELRSHIVYLSSDARLLNLDVASNLNLNVNDLDSIYEALKAVSLDSRINLNLLEHESISSFSQGERQRLLIIKSWLNKCHIRLYDESTSALDAKSEEVILNKILGNDDMSLFITHRITSALQFPRVIVLYKGRIVEDGDPISLLSLKGHFYKLWEKQCSHISHQKSLLVHI